MFTWTYINENRGAKGDALYGVVEYLHKVTFIS